VDANIVIVDIVVVI